MFYLKKPPRGTSSYQKKKSKTLVFRAAKPAGVLFT